jgi:glycosyltransferase involved in cell wall biosynthesis
MATIPVSVMILTKDEQDNLPGCLESVAWSDDIHVLDSRSTDDTVKIAEAFGAKVTLRVLDTFASHQNWGVKNLPFKYPWVFYIDADERITPKLAENIAKVVANPGENVAFNVRRRDFFMGRWLKHVQATPFYSRLFMSAKMHYEGAGHPKSKPDGPVGLVDGYLDHFPFSKGLADWVARHNTYSTREAKQTLTDLETGAKVDFKELFFAPTFHRRRHQLKLLFTKMPFRPALKFTWMYFLKLGFLDGTPGFTYAALITFHEYMINLKTKELLGRKS